MSGIVPIVAAAGITLAILALLFLTPAVRRAEESWLWRAGIILVLLAGAIGATIHAMSRVQDRASQAAPATMADVGTARPVVITPILSPVPSALPELVAPLNERRPAPEVTPTIQTSSMSPTATSTLTANGSPMPQPSEAATRTPVPTNPPVTATPVSIVPSITPAPSATPRPPTATLPPTVLAATSTPTLVADTPTPPPNIVIVTVQEAFVRDAPSIDNSIIGGVVQGDELLVLESRGGWYLIRISKAVSPGTRIEGDQGWITQDAVSPPGTP